MKTLNSVLTTAVLVSVLMLMYQPELAGMWFAHAYISYVNYALGY